MIRTLSACCALITLAYASNSGSAEPLPLEYFFSAPTYRLPRIAPDGRSYSIIMLAGKEEVLAIVDFATRKVTPVVKTDARFRNYWWKTQNCS